MFSCEFCKISRNTFFKKPFGRLLLHKHSFGLLSHHGLLFFQKRCHTYFPAKYFLGLIYRLATRVSSVFQTLSQTPTTQLNICDEAFFSKIVNSLKALSTFAKKFPCRCSNRFWKRLCKQLMYIKVVVKWKTKKPWSYAKTLENFVPHFQIFYKFLRSVT